MLAAHYTVTSPLNATIYKILCSPGQVIKSPEETLLVLEAMKTEVDVVAGAENVGRKIIGLKVGKGINGWGSGWLSGER